MAQRMWLIRHGKSSRPFGIVDHRRPLAPRASADATLIREWLNDAPRLYVASTATRARQTAEMIAGDRPLVLREELYHAGTNELLALVEETLVDADRAAFVAHNPAVTELVRQLAGRAAADNVPTLGVAEFERAEHTAPWRLAAYVSPKALR